ARHPARQIPRPVGKLHDSQRRRRIEKWRYEFQTFLMRDEHCLVNSDEPARREFMRPSAQTPVTRTDVDFPQSRPAEATVIAQALDLERFLPDSKLFQDNGNGVVQ